MSAAGSGLEDTVAVLFGMAEDRNKSSGLAALCRRGGMHFFWMDKATLIHLPVSGAANVVALSSE